MSKKKSSKKSSHKRQKDAPVKVEIKNEPFSAIELASDSYSCRVCLKAATLPIFGAESTEDISESLSTFGAIDISEDDDLPKFLCEYCFNMLQNALWFRNTAQQTDKLLRQTKLNEHLYSEIQSKAHELIADDIDDENDGNISDFDQPDCKPKKYNCSRCNIDFENWKIYSDHTKSVEHKNFKVECPVCKRLYTTIYIKRHILRHRLDPEQAFICDVCGKSFVVLGALNRHKAIHGLELPFKCNLCPYRGRFSESLKMHMRTHTGEKPYACPQCSSRFVNKSNLNKHLSTHKAIHDYKCDGCGRGYFRKRDLELHIKVYHSGIKEHVCNICTKAFGYRKQMMKHQLKVHKREKLKSGRVPLYIQAERSKKNDETMHV